MLRLTALKGGSVDLAECKEGAWTADEARQFLVRQGDFLVARGNGSLRLVGRGALVRIAPGGVAFPDTLIRVRPSPGLEPSYLAYVWNSLDVRQQIERMAKTTAGIYKINQGNLESTWLPVAPICEQRTIAEALDSYLSRLDDAVANLERVRRSLGRYRSAVLQAAVEGRLVPTEAELAKAEGRSYEPASMLLQRILVERRRRWQVSGRRGKYEEPVAPDATGLPELPEGWCWASIDQLGEVTGGLTQNAKRNAYSLKMPFLRVANVYANRLLLDDVQEIGVQPSEVERALLSAGDLLVVEGNGSLDQIGRVARWDGSVDRCLHQNHLIKVRLSIPGLERWALVWLLAPGGRKAIESVASSTSGLHTLSISKVGRLPVPVPPASEQARLTEEVDRILSVTNVTLETTTAQLTRCQRLRQAILKWAFEGKLVDQDPDDEPADSLFDLALAQPSATRQQKATPAHAGG